jgi:DNA-binding response OmpR family regulator
MGDLAARVGELEAENARLKRLFAIHHLALGEPTALDRLLERHRLTGQEARVLESLLAAKGRVLSAAQLLPHNENPGNAQVYVHRLRRKLGHEAIENVYGLGWRASKALLQQA